METLTALAGGFAVALTPQNLLWALAGVTLGTAVGVLPGEGWPWGEQPAVRFESGVA